MDLVRTYSSSPDKSSDCDSPVKNYQLNQESNKNISTPSKNPPRLNLVEKLRKKLNNPTPGCSNVTSTSPEDSSSNNDHDLQNNCTSPEDSSSNNDHDLQNDCKCEINCNTLIASDTLQNIRECYRKFNLIEKRAFIREHVERNPAKRRRIDKNKEFHKIFSYQYFIKVDEGTKMAVCQAFFLFSIGYKSNSSNVIYRAWPKTDETGRVLADRRGQYERNNDLRTAMRNHLNSFNPVESHYRREHAPLARYLPSDLNKNKCFEQWKLYCQQNELKVGSKTLYRKVIKQENIRFVQPKQEDCEDCIIFFQHESESSHSRHNLNENIEIQCHQCQIWYEHIQDAGKSRALYNSFSQNPPHPDSITVSVDLEKIILLPRIDTVKKVIFTRRLSVYNETFACLGKSGSVFCCLWSEAVSGRKSEDILSAYYSFLKHYGWKRAITFFCDNCSAQNKFWNLLVLLVLIINSSEIETFEIVIHYLTKGHTFMSADSFHGSVEKSMQRSKTVYDYDDFLNCVREARSTEPIIKDMNHDDFFRLNYVANLNVINKFRPRPQILNFNYVRVERGSFDVEYSYSVNPKDAEKQKMQVLSLRQINDFKAKNCNLNLKFLNKPIGIEQEKKDTIIKDICPLMPENKREYWTNLPTKN